MSTTQSIAVQHGARPAQAGFLPGPATPARAVAMRLTGVDADALAAELVGLWQGAVGGHRQALRIDVSLVETCGRSGADRERDARRLLRAEVDEAAACACGCAMRATLVRLEPLEHLVLLACAPDVRALDALGRVGHELTRRHAAEALAID
jgi:hypothetical protein